MPFIILDLQLVAQGILYLTTFILGFIVSIPLGVTSINFGSQCILYADISWKNATYFTFDPSGYYNCNFPIYLCVFGCIFYGLGMTVYHGYALTRKDPNIGSQMWVMPFILLNSVLTVTVFISSCIISVGFLTFCDRLVDKNSHNLNSCSDGQDPAKVNWNIKPGFPHIDASTYFAYLTVCQTASWITFLVLAAQVVLGIIRFVRNRRLRSKDQYQDPPPNVDSLANSKTPADLEKFASVQPSA